MSTATALTLLGLGLGTLLAVNRRSDPRAVATLRERAIEAQRISAHASLRARELTTQWLEEQTRNRRSI